MLLSKMRTGGSIGFGDVEVIGNFDKKTSSKGLEEGGEKVETKKEGKSL